MKLSNYLGIFFFFLLTACASTKEKELTTTTNFDAEFIQLLDKLEESPNSVSYSKLWSSYLKSSQIDDSAIKQDKYFQIAHNIEIGELNCSDVDWKELTRQNFWSIKPHVSAQTCYKSMGNMQAADFHNFVIEYLLSGILANGDGENDYSAFEIATLGDAADVIELSGYEVIDSYLELKHLDQALYFIYVVNDPDTGHQREIYFENNRFLHAILEVQFPFAALNDSLLTSVIESLSTNDVSAKVAKAKILSKEGNYNEAVEVYLNAINQGSTVASYSLGMLCLNANQSVLDISQCAGYMFDAAENGYINASIALAFMYKEGIGVEYDEQIFLELMSSSASRLEPGDAWLKLAKLYNRAGVNPNLELLKKYLQKATVLGNINAEYLSITLELRELNSENNQKLENILARLESVASKGLASAQATYANILMRTNEKNSAKWNQAESWINKSAQQGFPFAIHLLGDSYQYGYFGKQDDLEAYLAYNEAAMKYFPKSQLNVGYFNDIGKVVESDQQIAISWYFLCSKATNLTCIDNLGIYFREGIIVDKNLEVAANHFRFASEKGYSDSTINLALLYQTGEGVETDLEKANELFAIACQDLNGKACHYLGNSYLEGTGVNIGLDKAQELFEKACNSGYSDGCNQVASLKKSTSNL